MPDKTHTGPHSTTQPLHHYTTHNTTHTPSLLCSVVPTHSLTIAHHALGLGVENARGNEVELIRLVLHHDGVSRIGPAGHSRTHVVLG